MLNHFTSKGYLVYAERFFNYGIDVKAIAIFNTEKRAIDFRDRFIKKHTDQFGHKVYGTVAVKAIKINPETLIDGELIGNYCE
ncbi:hypothetical protein Syn7502_02824 [Synechococcus sp. PCC 7502]|uniref:hypothetical protein n=1 Tax=Synechococcus sp. PCC 7502 TaxID=1173263 RepID=UPI00029FE760|nr:hypothetical protein [Synechococcus sp. PCC 7502]AFY74761.1 hypothetical protein Syn7502_02824 [Synechococcus sp. PCC 7502]